MLNVSLPADHLPMTSTGILDRAAVRHLLEQPPALDPIAIADGAAARLDRLAALADLLASYPHELGRERANTIGMMLETEIAYLRILSASALHAYRGRVSRGSVHDGE